LRAGIADPYVEGMTMKTSRRLFVAGSAAIAATSAFGQSAESESVPIRMRKSVESLDKT
jgi:hypothetical protein